MTGAGPRVAIVDDHALFRAGVRTELQQHVDIAGEAATVDEAVALIEAEHPDVVLLDVHLGNHSSDAFLEELCAAGIGVVLVTGTADASEYRRKVDEVVVKPFLPDQLVAAARRVAVR